jgi:hypothetical protein
MLMVEYMTIFNHHYRWDYKYRAYCLLDRYFHFETNSEGTDRWLGRALAIKDLYHLNWTELVAAMKMVSIRK